MSMTIIQISDTHLFEDPRAELKGVCTWDTFNLVLGYIEMSYRHADALIITGDLAHDEKLATYRRLQERIEPWIDRLSLVPGNHDDRRSIAEVFSDRVLADRQTIGFDHRVGNWRLIGLDSQNTGKASGHLDQEQLTWLGGGLNEDESSPTLVFLHHPPIEVHSAWLDAIRLENASEMLAVLNRSPRVRGVFFGHIHQYFSASDGTREYYAVPSTGVQFAPRTDALEIDTVSPGFRVIEIDGDQYTTQVVRVPLN